MTSYGARCSIPLHSFNAVKKALLLALAAVVSAVAPTLAQGPPPPPANVNFTSERGVPFGLLLDGRPLTRGAARQVHVDQLAPGPHWADFSLPAPYGRTMRFRTQVWLRPGLETSFVLLARPGYPLALQQVSEVALAGPNYGPGYGGSYGGGRYPNGYSGQGQYPNNPGHPNGGNGQYPYNAPRGYDDEYDNQAAPTPNGAPNGSQQQAPPAGGNGSYPYNQNNSYPAQPSGTGNYTGSTAGNYYPTSNPRPHRPF